MKIKAILFAAVGLLAWVNATANVHTEILTSLSRQVVAVEASQANIAPIQRDVEVTSVDSAPEVPLTQIANPDVTTVLNPCTRNCHDPWKGCVQKCGGSDSCEHQCNCELFSNPNRYCRLHECVQEPTNCPTSKRSVDPVNCDKHCHQPWLKCMSKCGDSEFCSHKCNCKLFQSSSSLCRHVGCVQKPENCRSLDKRDAEQPPINPCITCHAAVNLCIRECGGGEGCELSCKCNFKGSHPLCSECSIHCGSIAQDAFIQDRPDDEQDTVLQSPVKPVADMTANIPNPCVMCQTAIKACKNKCSDSTCEDGCNCNQKRYNASCKECTVPCHSLQQRRTEDVQGTDDESLVNSAAVALPVPISPCVSCQFAVNNCKKKCRTPGACDDTCNCYHKEASRLCKECKLACSCGHTCPRLSLRQRDTLYAEDNIGVDGVLAGEDVKVRANESLDDDDEEVQLGIGTPVPDTSTCTWALDHCKAHCSIPGACDNDCNCIFKDKPKCKDLRLRCN